MPRVTASRERVQVGSKEYNLQQMSAQREFFLEAVKGNKPIGWWRGDRRTVMKAIFDYIMDERKGE